MSYGIHVKNLGKIKEVNIDLEEFTLITGNNSMKELVKNLFLFVATEENRALEYGTRGGIMKYKSRVFSDTLIEAYSLSSKFLEQKGLSASITTEQSDGKVDFVEVDCHLVDKKLDVAYLIKSLFKTQEERGYARGIYWIKNPENVVPVKERCKFIGELASMARDNSKHFHIVVETECPLIVDAINLAITSGFVIAGNGDTVAANKSKLVRKIVKSNWYFLDPRTEFTAYLLKNGRSEVNLEKDCFKVDVYGIQKTYIKTAKAIEKLTAIAKGKKGECDKKTEDCENTRCDCNDENNQEGEE